MDLGLKYKIVMRVSGLTRSILARFSSAPNYPFFKHLSSTDSPDLRVKLHQYEHQGTGARVYQFENDDPEKAFASVVQTLPSNDKGCPHILEHLACCGSKRYPIRDPFFNMLKRSVNSYMNAWTGEDFTAYPFSSPNPKDFSNLYQVYLDLSMKPLLNELDFRQEGWRYEMTEEGRQLKGIVFNQMKGAYQDSERQLMAVVNKELMKGTPWQYDSGGHPEQVVNLRYSQLLEMFRYYYHPSNMAYYYYGRGDIKSELDHLHRKYLANYKDQRSLYIKNSPNVNPQAGRRHVTIESPSESNNISISFLLGALENISPTQLMALRVLSYLLLTGNNAHVYRNFVESGVAQRLGSCGLNQGRMATFSVTLKGIYSTYSGQKFEQEFMSMLSDLVKNGVDSQRVEEYLHQWQVNLLTPNATNGIKILEETLSLVNHRLSLDTYLNPRQSINEAVKQLKDENFLQNLCNKFFINNERMVVVRQLMNSHQEEPKQIVSEVEIDSKTVKRQQQALAARQGEIQDITGLPGLKMTDIVGAQRTQATECDNWANAGKLYKQYHVKVQGDLNHYRLVFTFTKVGEDMLRRLNLWTYIVNRVVAAGDLSYQEMSSQLAKFTNDFHVHVTTSYEHELHVVFEFATLKKNVSKAFELLGEIVLNAKLNQYHTLNGFKAYSNESASTLIENPFQECLNHAGSPLSKSAYLLDSYQRIKDGLEIIRYERMTDLHLPFKEIAQCPKVTLIEHSNQAPVHRPEVIKALMELEGNQMDPLARDYGTNSKAVTWSYLVNFCTQQFAAPIPLSQDHAEVSIFLELLQQEYLHPLIREKGGAYGAFAQVRNNGTIALSSYADPNSTSTFDVFTSSIEQMIAGKSLSGDKLLGAKVRLFSEVDRIRVPQNQAVNQILKNYTEEQYEQYRTALKQAKIPAILKAGKEYLLNAKSTRCLFGRECPPGFEEEHIKDLLN